MASKASSQKKRNLTKAEKSRICRFHDENPLLTHAQVGAFFRIERSTVSKLVPQSSSRNLLIPSVTGHSLIAQGNYEQRNTPPRVTQTTTVNSNQLQVLPEGDKQPGWNNEHPASINQFTPTTEIQRALTRWIIFNKQRGIKINQATIRQEAATLAAMCWNQDEIADQGQLRDVDKSSHNSGPVSCNCVDSEAKASNGTNFDDIMMPLTPASQSAPRPATPTTPWEMNTVGPSDGIENYKDFSMAQLFQFSDDLSANSFDFDGQTPGGVLGESLDIGPGRFDDGILSADDVSLLTLKESFDHVVRTLADGENMSSFDCLCIEHMKERLGLM